MAILPVGISGEAGAYQIERSLRFNSADSAYLNRTFGTPTDQKKCTLSLWYKASKISGGLVNFNFLANTDPTVSSIAIAGTGAYGSTYQDRLFIRNGNANKDYWNMVFRDPSAWYHIVVVIDTTQGTQADRAKAYVNGIEQSKGASAFGLNDTLGFAASGTQTINGNTAGYYGDGYLAEYYFIDGQALTPSSFGETDSDTGVWKPKAYSGSYGTNGFYLDFADNSNNTATTLGKDSSGNGNNWTPNQFSISPGAGNDSLVDSPTRYGTDTGVGGEVRGNYATWNPLDKDSGITSVTEGNLKVVTNGSDGSIKSTIAFPSGKWYWEVTSDSVSGSGTQAIGIMPQTQPPTNNMSDSGKLGYAIDASFSDRKFENGTATSYGSYTQGNGVVYMLAFDQDAGKLWYGVDGTWLASGAPATGSNPSSSSISTSTAYCAAVSDNTVSGTFTVNFGQRPFAYTAPSGFKALCTTNLPEPTILDGGDYFNAVLWTGNSSASQAVTGVGFQPDLVWAKSRPANSGQDWVDAVRGATKNIQSSSSAAETTSNTVISFQSDGFTVGDGLGYDINKSGESVVGWCWKESATAGFDIVTYTGDGVAGRTVAHNLGVAPAMIICKNRVSASNWRTYHTSLGATQAVVLDGTGAAQTQTYFWNDTAPTSSVFSVGTNADVNENGAAIVAYLFAAVPGFSAFGSYTGNGSTDGTFVFTGFRPRYVLIKRSSGVDNWFVYDTARGSYNLVSQTLQPNSSGAEDTTVNQIDILSNGFKCRSSNTATNQSSETYVYACFAENPMKFSLAR